MAGQHGARLNDSAVTVCGGAIVRSSIQIILLLRVMCCLSGCFGPDYGPTYGYPTSGYSPYSYGLPTYTRGYAPDFDVHHPWEQHHGEGHHESFYHGPPEAPHLAEHHVGGPVEHAGGERAGAHHDGGHNGGGGR